MKPTSSSNGRPQLTTRNYHEFRTRALIYFEQLGLSYVLDTDATEHQLLSHAFKRHEGVMLLEKNIIPGNKSYTQEQKNTIAIARYTQDLASTRQELTAMLDAQDLERVKDQQPADMWKTLEKIHQKAGATNVMILTKAIQGLTYARGEMRGYLGEKRKKRREITAAGGVFTDDQLKASILDGLGSHFKTEATVLRMSNGTTTLEGMEESLILAEDEAASASQQSKNARTHTHTDEPAPQEPALANMAGGNSQRPSGATFQGKCDHCGTKGHKKSQCFWLHPQRIHNPDMREQWEQKIARAAKAQRPTRNRARRGRKKHKFQGRVSESEASSASDSDAEANQ